MSDQVTVYVIKNGPLKISGHGEVRYCGQALKTQGDAYICRCGESKSAPFCDGQHAKAGFSDEGEPRKNKEIKVWEGKTLRTYFNPNACMHVYYCKPLAELREAEVSGDPQAADEIRRVVGLCPSGALSVESVQGVPHELDCQGGPVDIDIVEGGEVRVQCAFEINAELQDRQPNTRATLCRCGVSKNKPWCDGRHKSKVGFR